MPPSMPNPQKRFAANPVRPARYRPGKAVPEEPSSDEDDEEEIEQPTKKPAAKPQPRAQPQKSRAPIQQEEEEDDEEGFVTDEEEEKPAVTTAKTSAYGSATGTIQRPPQQQPPPVTSIQEQQSEDDGSQEDSEEESSEEEDEESSSEDEPQRKFQRPTFIRKADRQRSPTYTNVSVNESSDPTVDEQARRLAQAELYIKDKLERDAVARAQGKKAWDDDEEVSPEAQVDDTDGVDPAAEHAAWKLRELKRLKRDREAIEAREKEIEETERRRNLTQEEREAEDREYIAKQKEERDTGRGKATYLAKYHHKGAFFQDDEMAEILKKRDIMGAKFQDEVSDKTALPEYMRVRDMTKLGKKGRTRYTDLKGEDTGRFGDDVRRWRGAGYEKREDGNGGMTGDLRGVDERFLPDRERDGGRGGRDATGPTGANASAVGRRREPRYSRSRSRSRSRSKSPARRRDDPGRDRDRDRGKSYRPRRRSRSYSISRSRSRSRSRTPPRRKRSPSPYMERDKRRKVDVD